MFDLREIKLYELSNWDDLVMQSTTTTFFQTKEWLILWLKHFSIENVIYGIYENKEVIGIVPLSISTLKGSTLKVVDFLGVTKVLDGELVSDFGDIIAVKGKENEVWKSLLGNRQQATGNSFLELNFIREDSPSFEVLKALGGEIEKVDVSPYLDLPKTWEEYLSSLDRHNRHELKRKMRKIEDEDVQIVNSLGSFYDINELFRLMILSDEGKSRFLSQEMKAFFRDLITSGYNNKTAELSFMQKDNINIAATLSFFYRDEVLLYNSGYDPKYSYLSAGLLLKAHLIKRAIAQNKKRFDFLRGNERYKYDLGGKERKLYKLRF